MLPINGEFHRLLAQRDLDFNKLAAATDIGRSHLSQVLSNKPGRGRFTRRRLFPLLTVEEIAALDWTTEYLAWILKHSSREGLTNKHSDVPMEASQAVQG